MALMSGTQPKGMQYNFSGFPCGLCGERVQEDPRHILFECKLFSDTREVSWQQVLIRLPPGMLHEVTAMNDTMKTNFVINGPGGDTIINEWLDVYSAIICFVFGMYCMRKEKYDMFDIK